MSFLINWELLNDGAEAEGLREFLNARFREIERPPFLGPLKVTELDFGDVPPEVAVVDICDPAPEFYLPDDPEVWQPSTPPAVPTIGGISGDVLSAPLSPPQEQEEDEWGEKAWSATQDTGEHEVEHRDDISESYFYGSHHPSASAARDDLLRRQRLDNRDDERDFATLAAARNLSSDDFPALAGYHRRTPGLQTPHRERIATNIQTPPVFTRPPAYGYGSGWSGSVGLGLGLGIGGTRTASNHSHHIPHPRPVFSSAPPSLAPSMARSFGESSPSENFSVPELVIPVESPRLPRRSDHEVALEYAETMRRSSDAQIEFEIVYKGNMRLAVKTELIVNQPTPNFMVLPLVLTLTGFHFTASALISYLGDRVNFCFKESDAGSTILQDLSIDSEVGDGRKQGVLKNVGRIERFIVEQLRKVLQDFLVFPNHQSLKLLEDPPLGRGDEDLYDNGSEPFDDGLSYEPPFDRV
ncbi:hypothetical protein PhCBS80983_g00689 [Powellomyces hirtus]|uniref:Mitochondrial distribution and morphology protein 12 n=1 Tax=Powellomyces hirtus TaxID=109895 RepID=A0A507EFY2_9FUNG|nr:hypothetical protein PhCBS80983_g00689 [Powellomyces hirtus]